MATELEQRAIAHLKAFLTHLDPEDDERTCNDIEDTISALQQAQQPSDSATEKLAAMLQGLEFQPAAAAMPASVLGTACAAIAKQAKRAADSGAQQPSEPMFTASMYGSAEAARKAREEWDAQQPTSERIDELARLRAKVKDLNGKVIAHVARILKLEQRLREKDENLKTVYAQRDELQQSANGAEESSFLGWVRRAAIEKLRTDDEVTGVMVHAEEQTDSVKVYTDPPPLPEGVSEDLLTVALEANDLCRSAHAVAERVATQYATVYAGTNFGALHEQLNASLKRQHEVLAPHRARLAAKGGV